MLTSDAHVVALLMLLYGERFRDPVVRRCHLADPKLPPALQPRYTAPRRHTNTGMLEHVQRTQPQGQPNTEVPLQSDCQDSMLGSTNTAGVVLEDVNMDDEPLHTQQFPGLGLLNDANNCYCIAVLQCLRHISLANHIPPNPRSHLDNIILNVCARMERQEAPFSVQDVITSLNANIDGRGYVMGQYQDAGEFLMSLLDKLTIPDGVLTSWPGQLHCPLGHIDLQFVRDGKVLRVNIPRGPQRVSLNNLYNNHFVDPDVLQGHCQTLARNGRVCGRPCQGFQITVEGLISVIEINRRIGLHQKCMTVITEPEGGVLDGKQIQGIICHSGNQCSVGHWFTFLKDTNNNWWQFDDHRQPVQGSPWDLQGDRFTINILFLA